MITFYMILLICFIKNFFDPIEYDIYFYFHLIVVKVNFYEFSNSYSIITFLLFIILTFLIFIFHIENYLFLLFGIHYLPYTQPFL